MGDGTAIVAATAVGMVPRAAVPPDRTMHELDWPQGSDPADSGPGALTDGAPVGAAGPAPQTHPTGPRYGAPVLVGRGGMGRVERVYDALLAREVAKKTALRPSANLAERLRREARLAARLDHPSIVPVYDLGEDDRGAPWYTMRLVRGRSLAEHVDGRPLADRLRLISRLLQAAQAVAFAHEHGVIHRDLKPTNILLGTHGETLVVDWGLAVALDEEDPLTGCEDEPGDTDPSASGSGARSEPPLTRAGAVVGTPEWMSPEQARGTPPNRSVDVYALGRLLGWLLDAPDAAPPADLLAIARKATSDDPSARYPTAAAFASDLADWLDGRPVSAHDYTARELAGRFVRAFRLPLAVAAAALGIVAIGAWAALRATEQERDRAVDAEQRLRVALSAERGDAAAQALRALDPATAAERARASLALGPGAEALAAASAAGTALQERAVKECARGHLSPDGALAMCTQPDGALAVVRLVDGATLRTVPAPGEGLGDLAVAPDAVVWTAGGGSLERWGPDGTVETFGTGELPRSGIVPPPRGFRAAMVDQREVWLLGPGIARIGCGADGDALAFLAVDDGWVIACSGGRLHGGRGAEPGAPLGPVLPGRLSAVAALADGFLLGTLDGEVLRTDRAGVLQAGPVVLAASPIRGLGADATGATAWVRAETGPLRLVHPESLGLQGSLPTGRTPAVAGSVLRLVRGDAVAEVTWGTPRLEWATLGAGISTLAAGAAGLAVGTGSGLLTVLDDAGGVVTRHAWQTGVIKDVAYGPDGRLWVVGVEPGTARVLAPPAFLPVAPPHWDLGARRLAPLADGSQLMASFRPRVDRIRADGEEEAVAEGAGYELARADVSDPTLLRKRLDGALARLRTRLVAGGVRPDLVRSNGQGEFELLLEPGDVVEDQL